LTLKHLAFCTIGFTDLAWTIGAIAGAATATISGIKNFGIA
jgi:hypothetical protein